MLNLKQLLIALHHITIILQFNRLKYSIQEILLHDSFYSYKLVNDYSAQSIKMVYQSTEISLIFYMIFTASYTIQLIVLFFRSNKNLNRYIYYHIYLLILLYTVGQLVQIYYYNFQEELTKLTSYQNQENKQDIYKRFTKRRSTCLNYLDTIFYVYCYNNCDLENFLFVFWIALICQVYANRIMIFIFLFQMIINDQKASIKKYKKSIFILMFIKRAGKQRMLIIFLESSLIQ
ncbi:unnamed protein product [Paramecium sonneborni]|uniref:Transmembrane protein n=1 Tax=Paramecium sonneborni TaxID=65129 RepID=A0A8S1PMW9_9CILI|nr:unnamed protein product [Paramecium sonneborni]